MIALQENPVFNTQMEEILTTTEVHAREVNNRFRLLLENDSALQGTKANRLKTAAITLETSKWQGDTAPFLYTLSFDSPLNQFEELILDKPLTITEAQRTALQDAEISVQEIQEEIIILRADGFKPNINIPIKIGMR